MGRRHARGFSLLEAMVTLVIVSLIIALLMQALSQVLGMRARIVRFQQESRVAALQEEWFRDSVEGALVDLPDARGLMEGDERQFQLVTATRLSHAGLGRVGWEIVPAEGGQALAHVDPAGERIVVIAGPLEAAEFHYRGSDGDWLSEWQPAPDAAEVLPRLVRFTARGSRSAIDWIVPVRASPAPASNALRPDATTAEF